MRYAPILVNILGLLCTLLMKISLAVPDDSRKVVLGYDRNFLSNSPFTGSKFLSYHRIDHAQWDFITVRLEPLGISPRPLGP